MEIEWFRDLVICIFGIGAIVAIIVLMVMAFIIFFRIKPVLDSVKATAKTVENITYCVETEVAGPLSKVIAFVQGIQQAVGLVNRFTRKKEED